ncbi:complex I subunit 1/NuoH family protein [Mesoterricola sediminis]|uniref:NADH-quinone oxidoreductase subunit H n=1 Tax=Mesoterricola sediminis TaxID=2927980 RepID=A0AA48GWF8_9BACT|nr:complex I subunit 1 family protein [Mesoterricola sediminis]BDU78867.1 NADH-quinone oxidoreductase subunit H 1 [Mesoterricola sediminis]
MNAPVQMTLLQTCVMAILQAVAAVIFIFVVVPMTIYAERKVIGHAQDRLGATRIAGHRVGLTGFLNKWMWRAGKVPILSYWRGLPMLVGDIAKMFLKEDVVPSKADRAIFLAAPCLSMIAAVVVFGAISFAPGALFIMPKWFPIVGGLPFNGAMTDMNVGLLFILGIASVGVYGIVLGAWASNSKYPLLGGLRSGAQIVSYEVPLTLSLLAPVVLAGTLNFGTLTRVLAVESSPLAIPLMAVGFLVYLTCGFAETNRVPFDMPEAENELVAGFHTEYSGMRFGFFYLAEYINMVVVSCLAGAFFLGGPYLLPFGLHQFAAKLPVIGAPNALWYVLKIIFLLWVFIWVRATIPRYRYDQIMSVAWKYLIPLTLVLVVLAGAVRFVS